MAPDGVVPTKEVGDATSAELERTRFLTRSNSTFSNLTRARGVKTRDNTTSVAMPSRTCPVKTDAGVNGKPTSEELVHTISNSATTTRVLASRDIARMLSEV